MTHQCRTTPGVRTEAETRELAGETAVATDRSAAAPSRTPPPARALAPGPTNQDITNFNHTLDYHPANAVTVPRRVAPTRVLRIVEDTTRTTTRRRRTRLDRRARCAAVARPRYYDSHFTVYLSS